MGIKYKMGTFQGNVVSEAWWEHDLVRWPEAA